MSLRSRYISADSASISLIRWRSYTRMAAMLQMTATRIDSIEVFLSEISLYVSHRDGLSLYMTIITNILIDFVIQYDRTVFFTYSEH